MRKKGCYHKNRPFRLLVAAALRFVQSYLNDIAQMVGGEDVAESLTDQAMDKFEERLIHEVDAIVKGWVPV